MKQVIILGGGFAGVWAAMAAASQRSKHQAENINITLISNDAHLCIKPKLYDEINESILVPLQPLMDEIGVDMIIDNVKSIQGGQCIVCENHTVNFDKLIFTLGSQINTPIAEQNSPIYNVDSYEASLAFDKKIKNLIETHHSNINIHIAGSGFTGIELITKLHQRFGEKVTLTLIEKNSNVARNLGASLQEDISKALQHANVNILLEHDIKSYQNNTITFTHGTTEKTDALVLTLGVKANNLTQNISSHLDESNRVIVEETLQSPENNNIFVAGDSAKAKVDDEHYSLMSCQHAMPMGTHAGINAINTLLNIPLISYQQPFYATCLDLGASGALFTQGWARNIDKKGQEGAAMKAQINNQWIYPPSPSIGKVEIFKYIQSSI